MKQNKSILDDVDVQSIIKNSIKKDLSSLNEAYVAEPKTFRQVSELVSQKTKDTHVSLYKGYVEAVNRISAELDAVDLTVADRKHSSYHDLKASESFNLNSVWLHELYFANCFDPNSEVYMDSLAFMKLQRDFGTFEDWQKDFIASGLSVGNGWAVCGYHTFLKKYINTIVTENDCNVLVGLYPVIVVDMHEHSYFRDYLSDKKSYLIAQMRELNWDVVNERFKRSEGIHEVLK
jgi:Fe-Mn family superoxide dismutase